MEKPREYKGNTHRTLLELKAWTNQRQETALEPDLPILDPHHHLWDDAHRGRYMVEDLLEDVGSGHNVVASIFAEAKSMYRADGPAALQAVGEVEFINGVAAVFASGRYGKLRLCAGIVGNADLALGDDVQPVLEALIAAGNGRLRGIRRGVTWDSGNARTGKHQVPRYQLLDPVFRKGYARLVKSGLVFDAWLFYHQLADLADLLRAFPDAKVVLTHSGGLLGIPPHDGRREEVFSVWRAHIRELAQFPNLSVKVGGLGMLSCGWDFHLNDMPPSSEDLAAAWRPCVETCIESFGPDRCMMESNFPADKQSCGYGVLWNALKRITKNYSAAEKALLYCGTAARVYGINVQKD